MPKARNIAKILILTAVILLLGMSRYASAQNSSANPFIDSWHLYQIEMANTDNTTKWELFQDNTSGSAVHTLTNQPWVDISLVGVNARIEIKFIDANFNPGQRWFLVYSETNNATGNCVARRSFEINTVANTFFLSLPANDAICNNYTGDIWDNAAGTLSPPERPDNVRFTVIMNKDAGFLTDLWRFSGSITFPSGGATHLDGTPFTGLVGLATSGGTWALAPGAGGDFTMVVTGPANYTGLADSVTFSVNVEGNITEDYEIQLNITNGQAESGNLYTTVTDDNLNLSGGIRVVVRYIFGVPNTSVVMVTP